MKRIISAIALSLFLFSCKSTPSDNHCPEGVESKYIPRDMRDDVKRTCFTEDSKKIKASGWSKNKSLWDHTDLVLYFYPEKNLIGGDADLGGVPNISYFLKYVQVWEDNTNIRFFVTKNKDKADAIVGFDCIGNWSRVGRYSQNNPQKTFTLNLEWDSSTTEWEHMRSACHETGHLMGLEHEHQNPVGGIEWDEEAVYKFYGVTQGWTREQVRSNLLEHYDGKDVVNTGFDPESVMLYQIPASLTKNGFSSSVAYLPSKQDFQTINTMYPKWVSKEGRVKKKLTDYKSRLID